LRDIGHSREENAKVPDGGIYDGLRGHSEFLGNRFEVIIGLAYLDDRCNVGSFVSFLKVIVDRGDALRARAVILGIYTGHVLGCNPGRKEDKDGLGMRLAIKCNTNDPCLASSLAAFQMVNSDVVYVPSNSV
jgi:hypothetical protein